MAKAMWAAGNPGEDINAHHEAHLAGEINKLPWHDEGHLSGLPISDGERKRLLAQVNEQATKLQNQLKLEADNLPPLTGTVTGFGIGFPANPAKGDMFLRVDQQPTVLYKYNGKQWMEVDKELNDSYTHDDAYIEHLIEKIAAGEYDIDLLNDNERERMAYKLRSYKVKNGNND